MKKAIWLLVTLLLPTLLAAQPRFDFRQTPGRLSKDVVPRHYALHLDLDPTRDTFDGEATIRLRLDRPQTAIVLHARALEPLSVRVRGGTEWRVEPDEATQTWRLVPPRPLPAGELNLSLRWRGKVNRSDQGLFRAGGDAEPMLVTQLEAVNARSVFPSFDEPAFRARFTLEVHTPAPWQVLSNMPALAPARAGVHRFATTPPMPSYLLALAVGRFEMLSGRAGALPLRIVTPPGRAAQGAFALQAAQRLMPFFAEAFGQPYPLPKLDALAVPGVLRGAMENWGLVTFNETALLVDDASTGPAERQAVYGVMAHELAHQWFGNLVTAASWNEIWLNEAFATWLAARASEHFNPDWDLALQRRARVEWTLERDSGRATRPIRGGVVDERSVFDVFDNITYGKGGAVLTMLEQWMGPETFRRGLRGYMAERRFSNATAGDLWHHLSRAAGRDVATVARSWTDQTGFPLVTAAMRCEGGRTQLNLSQQRFVAGPAAADARLWHVPVRVARGDERFTLMLDRADGRFELPGCDERPLVLNADGEGFYRVRYEAGLQSRVTAAFASLPAGARLALMSDSFALAQTGLAPLEDWLGLAEQARRVDDRSRPQLFRQIIDRLDWLENAAGPGPLREALRRRGRAWLGAELQRLGLDERPGEPAADGRLRGALIGYLARAGDAEVRLHATRALDRELRGEGAIPGANRAELIVAAGRGADAERFAALRERLLAARNERDRDAFAQALAAGEDAGRAAQVLALALDPRLPPDLSTSLPALVANLSPFADLAYEWSVAHWQELAALSGADAFGAKAWLLPATTGRMWRREDATRLLADQERLMGAAGSMTARRMAETLERRATWRERDAAALALRLQAD